MPLPNFFKISSPALGPQYLRYKGIWDMDDLYISMVDWFRQKKYKFYEHLVKHKHPSPFGAERQYMWKAEKFETEYTKHTYTMYIHTYDCRDVEIIGKDGNPRTFTKGRMFIKILGQVSWDYEKSFDKNRFFYRLRQFINQYVTFKKYMEGWSPRFRGEMFELHSLIKHRLKMESDEYEHLAPAGKAKRVA